MSEDIPRIIDALSINELPSTPEGYQRIPPDELIQPGDLWSYFGAVAWFPTSRVGKEQFHNNIYVRKIR